MMYRYVRFVVALMATSVFKTQLGFYSESLRILFQFRSESIPMFINSSADCGLVSALAL